MASHAPRNRLNLETQRKPGSYPRQNISLYAAFNDWFRVGRAYLPRSSRWTKQALVAPTRLDACQCFDHASSVLESHVGQEWTVPALMAIT